MYDINFETSSDHRLMKASPRDGLDEIRRKLFQTYNTSDVLTAARPKARTEETDGKLLVWHPTFENAIMMLTFTGDRAHLVKPATAYFQEQVRVEQLRLEDIIRSRKYVAEMGLTPQLTALEAIRAIYRRELANPAQLILSGRRTGRTAMMRIRQRAQLRLLAAHGFMRRSYLRGKYIRNHKGKARKVW